LQKPFVTGDQVQVIATGGIMSTGTVLRCEMLDDMIEGWAVTVLVNSTKAVQTFNFTLFPERVTKYTPGAEN